MKIDAHGHLVFGGGTQKIGLSQTLASEYVHKWLEIVSLSFGRCFAF